jgi:S1-C subfamily serine protease
MARMVPWPSPLVAIGLLLPGVLMSSALLDAQQPASTRPDTTPVTRSPVTGLDRARRATVSLEITGINGQSSGSGVLVSSAGVVATAAHVIHGATQARVRLANGETYDVVGVLDYDERLDAALLAIAGFELPAADLGNADSIRVGQRIIAVGSPLGLEATVTDGIVSAIRLENGVRRLQISAPVAPGSSGGPLLTEQGQLVGLVVAGIRGGGAENLNFALPINYVRGKLAFVASKAPTPFSEIKYGAGAALAGVPQSQGGIGVSTLARVNSQLGLDFMSLDGAQIATQQKGKGQLRLKNVVWYVLSQDPNGVFSVERAATNTYRSQGLIAGQDFARETSRTVYQIGQVNRFSSQFERVSADAGFPSARSELVGAGGQYSLQVNGATPRTGSAPPGVFPSEFVGAVTAALPDPIPARVSFWILDAESDRLQEVTLEVLGTGRRKVPVAVQGQKCVDGTPTRPVEVEVVTVRRKYGLTDETHTVLARQPHLLVDGDVKCVRAKGLQGPAHAPPSKEVRPM